MAKGVREPAWSGALRQARDLAARALVGLSRVAAPTVTHAQREEVRR
jgi:hypothetical protein